MRKIFALALAAISFLPVSAQDKIEATVSGTVVSRYMWRGADLAGPSLRPKLELAWKGLSLEMESNIPFDKDDVEDLDVTIGYSRWGFNIGVTDYWEKNVDPRNRYFYYSDGKDCPHQLEANIGYTCKYGSLQAYTMFYGNDYKINGDRAYSTYIELSVPFRAGGLDWDVRAGVTPMESAGETYEERVIDESGRTRTLTRGNWFYGESFTCNLASVRATKAFEFKHFKMPVWVELHANPYLQRANLVLGVSVCSF